MCGVLEKPCGFNSAQTVHEHLCKGSQKCTIRNMLRLNRQSRRVAAEVNKRGSAGSWSSGSSVGTPLMKHVQKRLTGQGLLTSNSADTSEVCAVLLKVRSAKMWRPGFFSPWKNLRTLKSSVCVSSPWSSRCFVYYLPHWQREEKN